MVGSRMKSGREFQTVGPATEKAQKAFDGTAGQRKHNKRSEYMCVRERYINIQSLLATQRYYYSYTEQQSEYEHIPCDRGCQGNGRCDPRGTTGTSLMAGKTTSRSRGVPSHAADCLCQTSQHAASI